MSESMLCSRTHEYITGEDGKYTVGLTDYAVEQLGDVVFVELPEVGATFAKNEVFSTVESVKAASEIFAPAGFKVVEVNEALVSQPELLNADPYKDGWLVKAELTDASELDTLMEYDDYKSEAH